MRLLPLRTGWSPAGPADHFYPADLPEDWRLTYLRQRIPGGPPAAGPVAVGRGG